MHLPMNDFASGGLMLMLVGGIIAYLRNLPMQAVRWVLSHTTASMTVDQEHESFRWIGKWLSQHPSSKRFKHVVPLIYWPKEEGDGAFSKSPAFKMVPLNSKVILRYKGELLLVSSDRVEMKADSISFGHKDKITITKLGRSLALFDRLLKDAYAVANPDTDFRVSIHHWTDQWNHLDDRRLRSPDTLILRDGVFAELLNDVQQFGKSYDRYSQMGIPFRRGYLFYGPPGNGKTSLAFVLASSLKKDVYAINLASVADDKSLISAMMWVSPGSIILLEDIDACWRDGRESSKENKGISFSGLLNVLDGMLAKEERIVIMTTNHRDRLDPALLRPGRADYHVHIDNPCRKQVETLVRRFHPDATDYEVERFINTTKVGYVSIASIQGCLMRYPHCVPEAYIPE